MDHREYSSGGSEYFPTGQEYSAPIGEFSRPAPELISAAPEVNCSGGEYHQTDTVSPRPKKRRKNISSAMLTTAAVAVAAVSILPLSGMLRRSAPSLNLSPQSQTYLNEVWDALPQGDPEQLAALLQDDRLRTLAVDEAADYIDTLSKHYQIILTPEDCGCNGEWYTTEGFSHHGLYYGSGQTIDAYPADDAEHYLQFHYLRRENSIERGQYHTDIYFSLTQDPSEKDPFSQFQATLWRYELPDRYHNNTLSYDGGEWIHVIPDSRDRGTDVLQSGVSSLYSYQPDSESVSSYLCSLVTITGDFTYYIVPYDGSADDFELRTFLYNGTIAYRSWFSDSYGEWDKDVTIEIVDGIPQLSPEFTIEKDPYSPGYYMLYFMGRYLASGSAESEEDFLAHLSWHFKSESYIF